MNITLIKKMPRIEDIIQESPMSEKAMEDTSRNQQEVKNILAGKDSRLLVIVGPCSAWPSNMVLEYARRLKNLETKVKSELKLVMRVYIQKPRTTKGWTGPVNL